ncbi:MAG: sporulation initiation factor Spo0A [Oscillospiraceae bacterium]|nr:sporulation initiation factor Spo0A [Oscillospiraceae bacterium]
MRNRKAIKAFEQIAARDGVSVEEVREKIQKVINIGFAPSDPAVMEQWRKIPFRGVKPTAEEVVMHLAKQVKK